MTKKNALRVYLPRLRNGAVGASNRRQSEQLDEQPLYKRPPPPVAAKKKQSNGVVFENKENIQKNKPKTPKTGTSSSSSSQNGDTNGKAKSTKREKDVKAVTRSQRRASMSSNAKRLERALRDRISQKYKGSREFFNAMDMDHDNEVSLLEFKELCRKRNLVDSFSDADIEEVFNFVDVDRSGSVGLDEVWRALDNSNMTNTEFVEAEEDRRDAETSTSTKITQKLHSYITTRFSSVRSAFRSFDTEHTGVVSMSQFGTAIKNMNLAGVSSGDVDKFVKMLDEDGTGTIDYSEFLTKFARSQVYEAGNYNPFMNNSYKITMGDDVHEQPKPKPRLTAQSRLRARLVAQRISEMMEHQFGSTSAFFRHIDLNKDGALSTDELSGFLKGTRLNLSDEDMDTFIQFCDSNGTGFVSLVDFTNKFTEKTTYSDMTMPLWLSERRKKTPPERATTAPAMVSPFATGEWSQGRGIKTLESPGRFDHTHKWRGVGSSLTVQHKNSPWFSSDAERFQRKGNKTYSTLSQMPNMDQIPVAGEMKVVLEATSRPTTSCQPRLYETMSRRFARYERSRASEQRVLDSYSREENRIQDKTRNRRENIKEQRNRYKRTTITDVMYYNDIWRDAGD